MSESQKKEAKRLFEILREMGILKKDADYGVIYFEARITEDEWIQKFTEAIGIFKAERIKEMFEKAGLK